MKILSAALMLFFPLMALANADHIVISEIQTYGRTATDEFIRLYNPTSNQINLSGWKLTKKTSSGNESNLVSSFADGTLISANSSFLVTHKTGYQGAEIANAAYSGASYSVANNNTVILKNADNSVIDKVGFGTATDYESAPTANPEDGKSIKRKNFDDTDNNKNDFGEEVAQQSPVSAPAVAPAESHAQYYNGAAINETLSNPSENKTNGQPVVANQNVTIQPPTTSAVKSNAEGAEKYVTISEILPNPVGSDTNDEYIKLFNMSDADINLGGFYLDDAEGGSKPYPIPQNTIVKAKDYITFYSSKTRLSLNNDYDSARLLDSGKEELQNIEYESAKEGSIYLLKDGQWQWLAPAVSTPSSSGPIAHAPQRVQDKTSAKTSLGSVAGTIIVPPNVFGARIAYINGKQLYLHSANWPDLQIGDKIFAYGEAGAYYGEPRFNIKNGGNISIVSRNNSANPIPVSGDEINDSHIGKLVAVEGEIVEVSTQKIFIDSAGAEIMIYKKSSALSFLNFKKGDILRASGILSKYKNDYRLMPRDDNDLVTLTSANNKSAVDKTIPFWQYVISTSVIGILGGGVYYLRRKKCQPTRQ